MTSAPFHVETVEIGHPSPSHAEAFHALRTAEFREVRAEGPPADPAGSAARLGGLGREGVRSSARLVYDADRAVGALFVFSFERHNPLLAEVDPLFVLQSHRRRGIGLQLFQEAVAEARDWGCAMLSGLTWPVSGSDGFAHRVKARAVQEHVINRLFVSELDLELVRSWSSTPPPGYDVTIMNAPLSDALLAGIAELLDHMRDVPRRDQRSASHQHSPSDVRRREHGTVERTYAIAFDVVSGMPVGLSDITWSPTSNVAEWDTTVVAADHRQRGLAKIVKGRALEAVLERHPAITEIRTGNVENNTPILRLNEQLGFRPELSATAWSVKL